MLNLESLPAEILYSILDCLAFDFYPEHGHPLDQVAAVSTFLNDTVERYTRTLILKYATLEKLQQSRITNTAASSGWAKKNKKLNAVKATKYQGTYRCRWLGWRHSTCLTCKVKTSRKAILDPMVPMCQSCDKEIPKMTMTHAITHHKLSKLDLFTPNPLYPDLPPLRAGSYMCHGGWTTMLSTPDVLDRELLIRKRYNPDKDFSHWDVDALAARCSDPKHACDAATHPAIAHAHVITHDRIIREFVGLTLTGCQWERDPLPQVVVLPPGSVYEAKGGWDISDVEVQDDGTVFDFGGKGRPNTYAIEGGSSGKKSTRDDARRKDGEAKKLIEAEWEKMGIQRKWEDVEVRYDTRRRLQCRLLESGGN